MQLEEKKYRVDSFDTIKKILHDVNAKRVKEVISTHWYGEHKGNDVEKFVEYDDRYEVHVLEEEDGRFTMIEHAPIADKRAGVAWLIKRGFTNANVVKMAYTEYEYKNGTVGLYVIDDFLHSIILYYPPGQHEAMKHEFRLSTAEVIRVPYNKYLEQLGKLQSIKLN